MQNVCCIYFNYNAAYRNLVNFRATNFSILIVRCGYSSRFRFNHEILSPRKKKTDDYYLEHDQLLDSDNDSLDSDKSSVTQEYLLEPTKARERI